MARLQTWRVVALDIQFDTNKSMVDIYQASDGNKVYRVRRAYFFNTQLPGGSTHGYEQLIRVAKTSSASGGTTLTPVPHDTDNTALPSTFSAGTGRTVTDTVTLRQFVFALAPTNAVRSDSQTFWTMLIPFAEIWNAGYGDPNIVPATCRPGQGFNIRAVGIPPVRGDVSLEIEFTVE